MPKKIFFPCVFLLFLMSASLLSARRYFNPVNYESYQGYNGAGSFVKNLTYAGDVTGYLIGIGVGIVVSGPFRFFSYDYFADNIATNIISSCTKGFGATFGGPSYFGRWLFYGTPKTASLKPENIIVNPKLLTAREKNEDDRDSVTKNIDSRIRLNNINKILPVKKKQIVNVQHKSIKTVNIKPQIKKIQQKSKQTEREKQVIAEHKKVDKKVSALNMTKREKEKLGLIPTPKSKVDKILEKRINTLRKANIETDKEGKLQNTQPASWNTPELPGWVKKQIGE